MAFEQKTKGPKVQVSLNSFSGTVGRAASHVAGEIKDVGSTLYHHAKDAATTIVHHGKNMSSVPHRDTKNAMLHRSGRAIDN